MLRGEPPEMRGQPFPKGGLAAFEPFNLKMNSRCRSSAGAADRHISDNHKSQDPRARGPSAHGSVTKRNLA
jgi:hypothetical protein